MWKMEFPSIFTAIFQHKLELFNLLVPLGLQEAEAPRFQDNRHTKVER